MNKRLRWVNCKLFAYLEAHSAQAGVTTTGEALAAFSKSIMRNGNALSQRGGTQCTQGPRLMMDGAHCFGTQLQLSHWHVMVTGTDC
jgi:hypothetical protein